MEERIDLVAEQQDDRPPGVSFAVIVSFFFHAGLLVLFMTLRSPVAQVKTDVPIARYVELIKQDPRQFTEAPGPEVGHAPLDAPYSDANRRASMPNPTGDQPTKRPGTGEGMYRPPMSSAPKQQQQQAAARQQQQQAAEAQAQQPAEDSTAFNGEAAAGSSRIPPLMTQASAASSGAVNWRNAIKEVGQIASIAGEQGIDLSGVTGGEKGSAEAGTLSFETQWYDWGPYARAMVSKIRVNWYANMPSLIRTGMRGVVTIRFTIHRDGHITDIETLQSSGAPPYDFGARKAIELSSPLAALPRDFPNAFERVTCVFYYNSDPPAR